MIALSGIPRLKLYSWVLCILFFFGHLSLCTAEIRLKQRPNVIVILLDDAGVETVSAYGSEIPTPNIDNLAAEGVLFENGHATPMCTPSRTRLLTGTYNFRHYKGPFTLEKDFYTLPSYMSDQGYETAVVGKWQLGGVAKVAVEGSLPEDVGYDEHFLWNLSMEPLRGNRYWGPTFVENGERKRYCNNDFGPDVANQYLLDFIRRKKNKPFFIFYPMMLPHDDSGKDPIWIRTPDSMSAKSVQERFHGMMSYADKLVGKVVSILDKEKLSDNTVIWLVGDNGTHPDIITRIGDRKVRGGKWRTIKSGTHVPFIVKWPSVITAGKRLEGLADIMDLFPTIAAAVGGPNPEGMDGENLMPLIWGKVDSVREAIFMHYAPQNDLGAMVPQVHARFAFTEKWKLYDDGRFFDLEFDPSESQFSLYTFKIGDSDARFIQRMESSQRTVARAAIKKLYNVMDRVGDPKMPPIVNPNQTWPRREKAKTALPEPIECQQAKNY